MASWKILEEDECLLRRPLVDLGLVLQSASDRKSRSACATRKKCYLFKITDNTVNRETLVNLREQKG